MGDVVLNRVLLPESPFPGHAASQGKAPWDRVAEWPARWLSFPAPLGFALYRLVLDLPKPLLTRIHVSADERYELYIDGTLESRGSERGDRSDWFFESYDLHLSEGRHVLLARVWALGGDAPWAQTSIRPGFLLAADGDANGLMATGQAAWEVSQQQGISWGNASAQAGSALGGGPGFVFDCAKLEADWAQANSGAWTPAEAGELPATDQSTYVAPTRHYLKPAMLRPQMRQLWTGASIRYASKEDMFAGILPVVDEAHADTALQFGLAAILKEVAQTIPPHSTIRAIIDLGDYVCEYPTLAIAAGDGAVIRLRYAESLWTSADQWPSGNRDVIFGKVFRGLADEFRADGRTHVLSAPWWRAGRYVQLEIKTAGRPLEIRGLSFEETRHDMGVEFAFSSNIPGLDDIARVALRTLRMCSHETHMDCPYYEQLQYVGDTRLQVLLSFYLNPDARLARKALVLMDNSRQNATGLTLDSAPGEGKLIPPFALWWVAMIADYARWRGEMAFVRDLLPGAREVMERFLAARDSQGLLVSGRGWNYVDIAQGFACGVPPGGQIGGRSSVLHLQVVYSLLQLAEVEEHFGEKTHGKYWRACAEEMFVAAEKHYWDAKRQFFADDLEHTSFSQHAQVLCVLTRLLKPDRAAQLIARTLREKDLIACNIYFAHYLFEAASLHDNGKYLRERLPDWHALIEQGYKTFPEHFGHTRSECHAWSAHVLYHMLYTIVGIKPVGPSMYRLRIEPSLQPGEWIKTAVAHPKGMIHLDLHMDKELEGSIVIPRGVEIEGPLGAVKSEIT